MAGDEQVRAQVMGGAEQPRALQLTAGECWTLLASVPVGRVVFSQRALPAIRPVNHIVDGREIIIRSHIGAAITGHAGQDGAVVCYEADELDPVRRTGWSVIVTGLAQLVQDPDAIARYQRLIRPWENTPMDFVVTIRPEFITGISLAG